MSFIYNTAKKINAFGLNLRVLKNSVLGLPKFIISNFRFRSLLKKSQSEFTKISLYPCLSDFTESAGSMKGHYFHQDLFVAQKIFESNPESLLDIGSRIDGYVAHVASFRSIKMLDIRELKSNIKNIEFQKIDLTSDLDFSKHSQYDAISSLHAIEHFGLGRYGDPLDVNGHIKAWNNIYNLLTPRGIFYYSCPIGPLRVEYNAHRVFSLTYLQKFLIDNKYEIVSFSYVDDYGDINSNVELSKTNLENNFNCHFGCGIFELKKIK